MDEREKAIKGLSDALEQMKRYKYYTPEDVDELEMRAKNVVELLENKDATKLVHNYIRPGVYGDLWLHCERCGEKVDDRWHPKYCPGCGRKVKWD